MPSALPQLPYLLLAFSTFLLWLQPKNNTLKTIRKIPHCFFALTICSALFTSRIDLVGFTFLIMLAGALYGVQLTSRMRLLLKILAHAFLIFLTLGLSFHRFPGFFNLKIIDSIKFSSDSLPYTMYLNFDKPLFGFLYILFFLQRIKTRHEWKSVIRTSLFCFAPCAVLLMGTAFALHYGRFDPKFPSETWIWMISNIFFTCVSEEAFFRGYIQHGLTNYFHNKSHQHWIPLVLTSFLFGLSHFKAGSSFVLLASIAGIFYGYAYQRTKKIEASILTHVAVNSTHFFFFSYLGLVKLN